VLNHSFSQRRPYVLEMFTRAVTHRAAVLADERVTSLCVSLRKGDVVVPPFEEQQENKYSGLKSK
jgi:hypothetical protein